MVPAPKKLSLSLNPTLVCVTILVFTSVIQVQAQNSHSSIVCRENLSTSHRNALEVKLRQITGFFELRFDGDGALRLGSRGSSGGSVTAQELLTKAISGRSTIILEDASRRSDVVFARVIPGKWKQRFEHDSPVFIVLLDFADFDSLVGDKLALSAFDVGWAFLHEVDHVVQDSLDSGSLNELGECEDHINKMRQECNLPLRADYFHRLLPINSDSEFPTKLVRLSFVQADSQSGKKRRYWVVWDANVVGGLDQPHIASLR